VRPLIAIATLAVSFVLSAAGPVHAQQPQSALPEQRSPFSEIAHDLTTWLTRVTGTGSHHHPPASSLPLPRPRPDLMATTAPSNKKQTAAAPTSLASEKQWSEVVTTSAPAPKKKSPAPVLIND